MDAARARRGERPAARAKLGSLEGDRRALDGLIAALAYRAEDSEAGDRRRQAAPAGIV